MINFIKNKFLTLLIAILFTNSVIFAEIKRSVNSDNLTENSQSNSESKIDKNEVDSNKDQNTESDEYEESEENTNQKKQPEESVLIQILKKYKWKLLKAGLVVGAIAAILNTKTRHAIIGLGLAIENALSKNSYLSKIQLEIRNIQEQIIKDESGKGSDFAIQCFFTRKSKNGPVTIDTKSIHFTSSHFCSSFLSAMKKLQESNPKELNDILTDYSNIFTGHNTVQNSEKIELDILDSNNNSKKPKSSKRKKVKFKNKKLSTTKLFHSEDTPETISKE